MKTPVRKVIASSVVLFALGASSSASAFDSGSTGADGAFNPTSDTPIQLPPNGVLNFTSVNIPAGVTVTFKKNASNTPVTLLVSGDFVLAGTIDISGTAAADTSNSSIDSGLPGVGGPGGYDGGRGGLIEGAATRLGGGGLGPGGGAGGDYWSSASGWTDRNQGGGGAGFASAGIRLDNGGGAQYEIYSTAPGGPPYGSTFLLPLIGGSGGGGGRGGLITGGAGGGGGGGAILVAVTGNADIQSTGRIIANGGAGGKVLLSGSYYNPVVDFGGCGGGGSGGAIRIIGSVVKGNGQLIANGGGTGANCTDGGKGLNTPQSGGDGSKGRIRVEGDRMIYGNSTNSPLPSYDTLAGPVVLPTQPGLHIASVAGVSAPALPTGSMDVKLPDSTTNPVTVQLSSNGIPLGTSVTLTATPTYGPVVTATSTALSGSVDAATATATISLPAGHSVLRAAVSYTVTAAMGDQLSRFAQGERVERIEVATTLRGESTVTLITVSHKRYTMPRLTVPVAIAG